LLLKRLENIRRVSCFAWSDFALENIGLDEIFEQLLDRVKNPPSIASVRQGNNYCHESDDGGRCDV
jgi:hypothetical protein